MKLDIAGAHANPALDQEPGTPLPPDRLLISETFVSIQGEGKLTGVPSFFIRVSGCNLRCGWCDTPYASWNPTGEVRTVDALVERASNSGLRHAVVTGGEPMIFAATTRLTSQLKSAGMHVTIETAGTVDRPVSCDLMSLSPKLQNSTPEADDSRDVGGVWRQRHEARRLNLEALQSLISAHARPARDFQLKFVVSQPAQIEEVERLLGGLRGWEPSDVLLMPEGVCTPTSERRAWVVDACTQRGWRYCHRLHIELFGNTRGT